MPRRAEVAEGLYKFLPPSQKILWETSCLLRMMTITDPFPELGNGDDLEYVWKIRHKGSLGRFSLLEVATPDRFPPLLSPYRKTVRITLRKEEEWSAADRHFIVKYNDGGRLLIHECKPRTQNRRTTDLPGKPLEFESQDDGKIIYFERWLRAKIEEIRENGQEFVNHEEAEELLEILQGKKVPYKGRDIFVRRERKTLGGIQDQLRRRAINDC